MFQSLTWQVIFTSQLIYRALSWPLPASQNFTPALYPTPTPVASFMHACLYLVPSPTPPITRHLKPKTTPLTLNTVVNQYRQNLGLPPLTISQDLCQLIDVRLAEITQSFNHDGFQNLNNQGVFTQLGLTSYAENIFTGSADPILVLNSWIESPGHQANLSGAYTIGCGQIRSGHAVYLFAR